MVYEGEYLAGKRNGQGKLTWAGGVYEGEWLDDKRNGQGKLTCKCEWSDDKHMFFLFFWMVTKASG